MQINLKEPFLQYDLTGCEIEIAAIQEQKHL